MDHEDDLVVTHGMFLSDGGLAAGQPPAVAVEQGLPEGSPQLFRQKRF
jgi:hypothetical protein